MKPGDAAMVWRSFASRRGSQRLPVLHHGKDDVDAPNEFCTYVFRGPEELLEILRGEEPGQWCWQDEVMPGE